MGQSYSLSTSCCASRERLNSDFKARGASPLRKLSPTKSSTCKSRDEWADDVEAGSPSLNVEMAPESEGHMAPEPAQMEPSGGCGAEECQRSQRRRLVTFQAGGESPMPSASTTPRFPESTHQDSMHSDEGPLRLRGMFESSQVSQDPDGQCRYQTKSEPPCRLPHRRDENIMVCRHGCCRAYRPDGVAKIDRLVQIIRRERQTHKRVLDFLAEHGFKGVNDSRRPSLGCPRWFPLHAAVSRSDAEMVRMLLHMGADSSRRNGNGLTAGELALRQTKTGHRCAFDVLAALEAHESRIGRVREGMCSVADLAAER
ncbi:unnamed protein product [Symbiodinium natans]|uniref:Uncharacterized protein n=1 Tax=Symbiodinium natans TaxID=878477 RepID=A0A812GGT9_9DINO|nr:unnamed protein product [Symbiodinium natans]